MRVTTQMLNDSARRAGLPIRDTSLLDYINKDESSKGLLGTSNSKLNAVDSMKKKTYENIEKEAGDLSDKAIQFLNEADDLFAEAKETGDTSEIVSRIMDMVDSYNKTIDILSKETDTLTRFYYQSLKDAFFNNEAALKELGITVDKSGKVNIDKDKLKAADPEALESVFGTKGNLSAKLYLIAGKVAANASAGLSSINNQYGSDGYLNPSQYSNRYDFWG